MARYRRRLTVRARQVRDPLCRSTSAATRARRHRVRRAARRDRGADLCRGRPHTWDSSRRCGPRGPPPKSCASGCPRRCLCQGDDTTSALVQQFADDPSTSLFGTLSLWQGVDVPGPSLSLVLIDRIPFPRPDDPLLSARQRAVAARGGNGFMAVAASHAALLLAQGAGRLLRRSEDRGVVAVLDSRMATARYGGYLRASLPPFWATTDPDPGPASSGTTPHRERRTILTAKLSGADPGHLTMRKGAANEPTTPHRRRLSPAPRCSSRPARPRWPAPPSPSSTIRSAWRACPPWTGRRDCGPTPRSRRATWRTATAVRSTNSPRPRSATSRTSGRPRTARRSTTISPPSRR